MLCTTPACFSNFIGLLWSVNNYYDRLTHSYYVHKKKWFRVPQLLLSETKVSITLYFQPRSSRYTAV